MFSTAAKRPPVDSRGCKRMNAPLWRHDGAIWRLTLGQRIPSYVRTKYTVPSLLNHDELQQNGIPGLLSPEGFKIAYTDYQQHMVDNLSAKVAGMLLLPKSYLSNSPLTVFTGTPLDNQDPKSLVIELARDPTKAWIFNHASMAFNNHFFFRGINTNASVQSQPSQDLLKQIMDDFSSMDTLRETFINTADAMFGPGFVWLVQVHDRSLRILPTYLAGSPLSGAHERRQSHDLNTHNADSYRDVVNKAGTFGAAAKQDQGRKKPLGGVDVVPLLCVNTWQHVWLHDYGVRGRRKYLNAWWDKIDWEIVRQPANLSAQTSRQFDYASNNFV